MGLIFRNTFLKGRSMSQEKVKRDFGVGAQHHSPQLVLSHMLMGTGGSGLNTRKGWWISGW